MNEEHKKGHSSLENKSQANADDMEMQLQREEGAEQVDGKLTNRESS